VHRAAATSATSSRTARHAIPNPIATNNLATRAAAGESSASKAGIEMDTRPIRQAQSNASAADFCALIASQPTTTAAGSTSSRASSGSVSSATGLVRVVSLLTGGVSGQITVK
jgi:hypothetical protein